MDWVPDDAVGIDSQLAWFGTEPAQTISYHIRSESGSGILDERFWTVNFITGQTIVHVEFVVLGLDVTETAMATRMAEFKPLFRLMAESITLPLIEDKSSAQANSDNAVSLDDPVRDYLTGKVKTFSTEKHAKAKNAYFTINYPDTWHPRESNNPEVVTKIRSAGNFEAMTIAILELDLPADLEITDEVQTLFTSPAVLSMGLPKSETLVDSSQATIVGKPAGILEYTGYEEIAGMDVFSHTWSVNFIIGRALVHIDFSVNALRGAEADATARMAEFRPLFKLMADSITVPQSHNTDTVSSSNTTPLDSPMMSFNTDGHPNAKGVRVSIDYPKTWVASDDQDPNIVGEFTNKTDFGLERLTIVTTDVPVPEGMIITEEVQEMVFADTESPGGVPDTATLVDAHPARFGDKASGVLQYYFVGEFEGVEAVMQVWRVIAISGHVFVEFQFQVVGYHESEQEVADRMAATLPLFMRMANSITYDELEVGSANPTANDLDHQACDAGTMWVCHNLGVKYQDGLGVEQDALKAVAFYERACDGGEPASCVNLGLMYKSGKKIHWDTAKAIHYYKLACDGGDELGCFHAGNMYSHGDGVSQDKKKAAELYDRACEGGDADGCGYLGVLYSLGTGVTRDESKSSQYFERACNGDHSTSCNRLGKQYELGLGIDRNLIKAASLYRRACNAGVAAGCKDLGFMYRYGKGVERDISKALDLYQQGCDLGLASACAALQ